MEYKRMLELAKQRGMTTTEKMWESIASVEELLDMVDSEEVKRKFYRRQHEILYGEHYNEEMAEQDVSLIVYTDNSGVRQIGCHWSCHEVESSTRQMQFGNEVTKWDKYVGMNAMYADLCRTGLSDEQIIKAAHAFFFCDEDWPNKDVKIWQYMSAKTWYESRGV